MSGQLWKTGKWRSLFDADFSSCDSAVVSDTLSCWMREKDKKIPYRSWNSASVCAIRRWRLSTTSGYTSESVPSTFGSDFPALWNTKTHCAQGDWVMWSDAAGEQGWRLWETRQVFPSFFSSDTSIIWPVGSSRPGDRKPVQGYVEFQREAELLIPFTQQIYQHPNSFLYFHKHARAQASPPKRPSERISSSVTLCPPLLLSRTRCCARAHTSSHHRGRQPDSADIR